MLNTATALNTELRLFDGRYQIVSVLGRGRFSVVYRAKPITTGERNVALKVLVNAANTKEELLRFRNEALLLLNARSEYVIKLYDFVVKDDLSYLVTEWAEGGDLKCFLLNSSTFPLNFNTAIKITLDVLEGLEAIHGHRILHRDIKPENILLSGKGKAKLADFGIACLKGSCKALEEARRGVGTFEYLAPEVLDTGICTEASDLYSTSIVFYELLTGRRPFEARTFAEQIQSKLAGDWQKFVLVDSRNIDALNLFFEKALNPNPEKRFASVVEFREAINELRKEKISSLPFVVPKEYVLTPDAIQESVSPQSKPAKPTSNEILKGSDVSSLEALEQTTNKAFVFLSGVCILGLLFLGSVFGGPLVALVEKAFEETGREVKVSSAQERLPEKMPLVVPASFKSVGLLHDFLISGNDSPLVVSGEEGDSEVLITIGVPGWQPTFIAFEKLAPGQVINLSSGGLQVQIMFEEKLEQPSRLVGFFRESTTMSTGKVVTWF